jgi:uncharacterized membrane protein required for colicin V production
MVWDGLILALILTLAVAGWNVGIVNSWRGPLALLIATLATQQFYVDFSTWIIQQLRVTPEQAIAIGYVLLWGAFEILIELLLNVALPFNKKTRPMFFERFSGAGLGIFKALVVILLPLIALTSGPIKVPRAPADKSALINPMDSGIDKSALVAMFTQVARQIGPGFSGIVVSSKEPSFKPNFAGTSAIEEENKAKP